MAGLQRPAAVIQARAAVTTAVRTVVTTAVRAAATAITTAARVTAMAMDIPITTAAIAITTATIVTTGTIIGKLMQDVESGDWLESDLEPVVFSTENSFVVATKLVRSDSVERNRD